MLMYRSESAARKYRVRSPVLWGDRSKTRIGFLKESNVCIRKSSEDFISIAEGAEAAQRTWGDVKEGEANRCMVGSDKVIFLDLFSKFKDL